MGSTIADHSQNGEFLELLKLIVARGAPGKDIVDVGANGRERSNSYDLMLLFGWRGLLIEANPALADQIRADFSGVNYSLVICAVSNFEGAASLSLGINSDISSLTPQLTEAWGPISGAIEVPVRRLHDILDEQAIPEEFEILSLDIEGHDARVLNDLHKNSLYRPRWVILEGSFNFAVKDPAKIGVEQSVLEDYELAGQTAANLILRHRTRAQ
jgi:FkbM family methyltransferase